MMEFSQGTAVIGTEKRLVGSPMLRYVRAREPVAQLEHGNPRIYENSFIPFGLAR